MSERFCNGVNLLRQAGLDTGTAVPVLDFAERQAVFLFVVGNPAGFSEKTMLFPDPALDLSVGRRLTYHNVHYDTLIEDAEEGIDCL